MEIIGLIAEYNPFHNGHIYHINEIKNKYPNSLLILILNGYFLMRGEVSILSKKNKTKIALDNNIDIVVELPFFFGSNSADIFAKASIFLLDKLGCNKIVFGSESNNIELLNNIASKQLENNFDDKVKMYLDTGLNYPTALNKAIGIDLNTPNDLLGISYIKAIKELKSNITPETIQRTNDYHDKNSNQEIVSATNIRNKIKKQKSIDNYLPDNVIKYINPIDENTLFNLIKYQIITNSNLNNILSIDEGLDQRIIKVLNKSNSLEELIMNIKTKRYTYNRIQRMLIHILINFLKEDKTKYELPTYIKVLGFNSNGQKYLNKIKKELDITVSSKIEDNLIKQYELKCAYIYQLLTNENVMDFELSNKPIKK